MIPGSTRTRALAVAGAALVALALALVGRALVAGGAGTGPAAGPSGRAVTLLLALVGLAAAAWVLRSRPATDGDGDAAGIAAGADGTAAGTTAGEDGNAAGVGAGESDDPPAGRYRLVAAAPERTGIDAPLAGNEESATLSRAAEAARAEGSVTAGFVEVRPVLRAVLEDALVAGGATPAEAVRAIDRGTWTDDRVAAAVLSPGVDPPRRSPWERLRAWLWPGRVARRRIDRAVGALAAASEAALPPVPGRSAPRRVRVSPPTLAELRRGVDGSLRAAVDPAPGTGPDTAAAEGDATAGAEPDEDAVEGEP